MNKAVKWYILILFFLVIIVAVMYRDQLDVEALKRMINQAGVVAALLFMALVAIALFLPRIISRLRQGSTLTIDDLRQKIKHHQELLLLDVRSEKDYYGELGHIQGATNIPLEELPHHLDELSHYLEKTVAFICTTDRRSKKAAQLLCKQGFSDVHVVTGGMKQWTEKSYSLAK